MSDLRTAVAAARRALDSGCPPADLAHTLYATWYAAPLHPPTRPADLPDDLVAVLRAAHAGTAAWEGGWSAEEVGRSGEVLARRAAELRLLDRCDYVAPDRPGLVAVAGAALLAPARLDHVDDDGGWWFTHSPGWRLEAPEHDLVRLFWNIDAGDAAAVVAALTAELMDACVPWLLKCAVDQEAYARADVVVLYLGRETLDHLRGAIDDVRSGLDSVLREAAPPLTYRAGRGLAACDDPGGGESFGEHRCRLVAEGVLAGGRTSTSLDAVRERFHAEGVPPDRPYVASEERRLPWE
jgi:hypothetical protein